MRTLLILIIVLSAHFSNAQSLKIEKLAPSNSEDITDLFFLEEELEGKQLVMLGELTHQYGTIFEMKTRMVEYLHRELGFTTFAMEASMYDIWKKNLHQEFDPLAFNNTVYGVWSKTKEFQRLVNYINEHQLKVVGFDSQIMNTETFIDDFFDYCENNDIRLKVDEEDMAIIMEGVLEAFSFDEYDMQFGDYEGELKRIIRKIESFENNEFNYHWLQFTKNILATSIDAYKNEKEAPSYDFVSSAHNIRDAQMANNVLTYMRRHPKEKVILWADNIHVMNSASSVKDERSSKFISMGNHIKNEIGDKAYSLATLHANDSISYKNKWSKTPILKGSFEDELNDLYVENLFVSSNQNAMKMPGKHRLLSYLNFYESRLDLLHDGYIFIKYAKDATPYTTKQNIINEFEEEVADSEEKMTVIPLKEIKNTLFKGKVLDFETKEPIPYATVILEKYEIYRVCDETGNFEIPINQLSEVIYLTPNIEKLDEVVVTTHTVPKAVMRMAVKGIKTNNPITPFNYERYVKTKININDSDILDIDLLTKEYDQGYRQLNRSTRRVDQIKWNKNSFGKKLKNTKQLMGRFRQNALRYSNIVNRRKYRKFDLEFVKSKNPEDAGLYVIAFKTNRSKWNYTNRAYPTTYSGKVYVDRENYAIVKVIENWETTLSKEDIIAHNFNDTRLQYKGKLEEVKVKEESTCSIFLEYRTNKDKQYNYMYSEDSSLFDIETDDVEVIDYDYYNNDETVLRRVKYDESFWESFNNQLYEYLNDK